MENTASLQFVVKKTLIPYNFRSLSSRVYSLLRLFFSSQQDLLLVICINCNTHSQEDVDLIGQMTKMRLKSKPAITHYLTCVKASRRAFTIVTQTSIVTHTAWMTCSLS